MLNVIFLNPLFLLKGETKMKTLTITLQSKLKSVIPFKTCDEQNDVFVITVNKKDIENLVINEDKPTLTGVRIDYSKCVFGKGSPFVGNIDSAGL